MAKADQGIVLDGKAQEQPKDKKRAQEPSSRDMEGPKPRNDKSRDTEAAVIADADKTDVADRDRVHGTGQNLGLK